MWWCHGHHGHHGRHAAVCGDCMWCLHVVSRWHPGGIQVASLVSENRVRRNTGSLIRLLCRPSQGCTSTILVLARPCCRWRRMTSTSNEHVGHGHRSRTVCSASATLDTTDSRPRQCVQCVQCDVCNAHLKRRRSCVSSATYPWTMDHPSAATNKRALQQRHHPRRPGNLPCGFARRAGRAGGGPAVICGRPNAWVWVRTSAIGMSQPASRPA